MELLTEIKKRLSITGDFHDSLLLGYAEDVKQYLLSAGVKPKVVNSSKSVGCIARGVFDIWTKEDFSPLFKERVIQLTFIDEDIIEDEVPNEAPEDEVIDDIIPEDILEPDNLED